MDFTLGDVLTVAVPVVILGMVIWALNQAFKPRDFGVSEAERYQRELARRSAAHQAEQTQAALAARARANTQAGHKQPPQPQPRLQRHAQPAAAPASGRPPAVLPDGQLNPDFVRQLQSMARNGQKIQAIKLLRDYTRADLLSAKNYIDRL
ncbi:hypothetical protein [Arthrobacter cupressi]